MPETRIFIVRHGERGDWVSGGNFVEKNFDADGNYIPCNLNLERTIPSRSDGIEAFVKDVPLSQIGAYTATLLGEAYQKEKIVVDRIYSSPSLRVVQTAQGFMKGYGHNHSVMIEPGLFEWMGFQAYKDAHPSWMNFHDYQKMGVEVVTDYQRIYEEGSIKAGETLENYYIRSEKVIRTLLERHAGETVVCFAHSTSHDACTRLIRGGGHRTKDQFGHILGHSQYLCNIEIAAHEDGTIEVKGSPVPPLTVFPHKQYLHNVIIMKDEELEEDMAKNDQFIMYSRLL